MLIYIYICYVYSQFMLATYFVPAKTLLVASRGARTAGCVDFEVGELQKDVPIWDVFLLISNMIYLYIDLS